MKRLLFSVILFCIGISAMSAQSGSTFEKGDQIFSVGYGLVNTLRITDYSTRYAPISATYEYALKDNLIEGKGGIGVGGYIGLSGSDFEYRGTENQKLTAGVTDLMLGVSGTFHYEFVDKLDTYTGITLGYNVVSASDKPAGIAKSEMGFIWKAGAKYYLTENFAVMGELGWGAALLNLGLSYNIKAY